MIKANAWITWLITFYEFLTIQSSDYCLFFWQLFSGRAHVSLHVPFTQEDDNKFNSSFEAVILLLLVSIYWCKRLSKWHWDVHDVVAIKVNQFFHNQSAISIVSTFFCIRSWEKLKFKIIVNRKYPVQLGKTILFPCWQKYCKQYFP